MMISKGTSVKKREHPDLSHKIAAHLVSKAVAVSIGTTLQGRRDVSQCNELWLSKMQHDEHAHVAGIVIRSIDRTRQDPNRPFSCDRCVSRFRRKEHLQLHKQSLHRTESVGGGKMKNKSHVISAKEP